MYDFRDSAETRAIIEGISVTRTRPVTRRLITHGTSGVCQGIEVSLEFDPRRFTGSNAFLCGSVLEHFLGLYCSINAFVQTVATVAGTEGILNRWPPRAGAQTLL